jgi:hypothetical protein
MNYRLIGISVLVLFFVETIIHERISKLTLFSRLG